MNKDVYSIYKTRKNHEQKAIGKVKQQKMETRDGIYIDNTQCGNRLKKTTMSYTDSKFHAVLYWRHALA